MTKKSSLYGKSGRVFNFINYTLLVLFCITIIYPFIQQITLSLSTMDDANRIGLHLFTLNPTLGTYKKIFASQNLLNAYYWTILRCVLGTLLTLIFTTTIAYSLSRKYLPLRKLWTGLIILTMYFSGGLIPTFLLVNQLKMMNTIWALVLPGLINTFSMIIVRNYFMALPEEIFESAKIDGANDIGIFIRIVLPLSKPILATVTLWTLVGLWNEWFQAMIYSSTGKIEVLQNLLRRILNQANQLFSTTNSMMLVVQAEGAEFTPITVKAGILIVTTLPILCVYPFLQKYFVKGILIGSLKG